MADGQQSDLVREVRLIRSVLFGLLVLGCCALCLQVTRMVFPGPAPNGRELDAVREELRQLREELRLYHRPTLPPPVVVPVVPPGGAGAGK